MTIEAKSLMASLGTICIIQSKSGLEIEAQVVGFKENVILLMPFEGTISDKTHLREHKIKHANPKIHTYKNI